METDDHKCSDTKSIQLTHADIVHLFKDAGVSLESHKGVYVIPRDPALPLSYANGMLVGFSTRRFLMARWRASPDSTTFAHALSLMIPSLLS